MFSSFLVGCSGMTFQHLTLPPPPSPQSPSPPHHNCHHHIPLPTSIHTQCQPVLFCPLFVEVTMSILLYSIIVHVHTRLCVLLKIAWTAKYCRPPPVREIGHHSFFSPQSKLHQSVTLKTGAAAAILPVPSLVGSAQGLTGPVSEYCNMVR